MASAFAPMHVLPRRKKSPQRQANATIDNFSVASLNAGSSSVIEPKNLTNSTSIDMADGPQDRTLTENEVDQTQDLGGEAPVITPRSPSPALEALPAGDIGPLTSTPAHAGNTEGSRGSHSRSGSVSAASYTSYTSDNSQQQVDLEERLRVPVLGYEIMEERARFTVFRMQVMRNETDNWFIFRRYTDFVRLNDQLKNLFPHFRLALPPKKWFGDNFDRSFLDDRMLGLQAFVNNVTSHRDVCRSHPVRKFLCLDEPPGAHESLEESRALCESLEETCYVLQQEVVDKDEKISLLEEELALAKAQIESLKRSARLEHGGSPNSEVGLLGGISGDLTSPLRPRPQNGRKASLPDNKSSPRRYGNQSWNSGSSSRFRSDSVASAPCCSSTGNDSVRNSPKRKSTVEGEEQEKKSSGKGSTDTIESAEDDCIRVIVNEERHKEGKEVLGDVANEGSTGDDADGVMFTVGTPIDLNTGRGDVNKKRRERRNDFRGSVGEGGDH